MPPRLNKRQQRELEELDALSKTTSVHPDNDTDNDNDSGDADHASTTTKPSGFAALFDPGNDDDENEENKSTLSKSKKHKKKKKVGVTQKPIDDAPPQATSSTPRRAPTPARNEKKAAKKAKAKAKKAGNDELDEALAELSLKYSSVPAQTITVSTSFSDTLASLLSVSLANLDSEAEMRRFFGSKVIQASKADTPGSSASSSRRQFTALRSNLTRPKPVWAQARLREGLTVRLLTQAEQEDKYARQSIDPVRGEKWWTVEYSKRYKGMTKVFMQTVQAGDPQGLFDMARNMPWHADTLLQMAQVFRHREEYSQAVDFMERAMFAYERAFIGAFTFTMGLNRLDFDFVENRPFFLALHRQTSDLQRRGCLRTAFEFSRLLYSLDPWGDPHGALFHLDYLAFKGGMTDWLLSVFKVFSEWRHSEKDKAFKKARLNPTLLPGWLYARALALKVSPNAKDRSASAAALVDAVIAFPSVVPVLADKLEVALPATIRSHRDFKIEADGSYLSEPVAIMHLLSHLYVQRSLSLWKDHTDWFTETIAEHFASPPSTLSSEIRTAFLELYKQPGLQYSVYRHVVVLEYRTLFRYIPKAVFAQKSLDCDPLPPPTAINDYGEDFFEGIDIALHAPLTRRQRQAEERRLAMIIPDDDAREQFQAIYAVPHVAAMFPGGILQMIQALQDMPPDLLENMQAAMMDGENPGARGEMPGQMPGEAVVADWEELEDEDIDDSEDESEPDEEARNALAAPFRALSNWVVRGIWGNPGDGEDESSDEERERLGSDID